MMKQASETAAYFKGYACIFNEVDLGNDVILPNAFDDILADKSPKNISMLWQHDPSQPIGVWQEIIADAKGVYVVGKLSTAVRQAKDIANMLTDGVIDGLSIGFKTKRAVQKTQNAPRYIHALELWEISIVTFPMQQNARIIQADAQPTINADASHNFQLKLHQAARQLRRKTTILSS